jgi:hypothetical protein
MRKSRFTEEQIHGRADHQGAEGARRRTVGRRAVPDHFTFLKNRHGRFRQSDLLRRDDAAFGAATEVTPKFISPADPAARGTGAHGGQPFFAYSTNYLIDVDNAIIVDVEATTAIRQAEVLAALAKLCGWKSGSMSSRRQSRAAGILFSRCGSLD